MKHRLLFGLLVVFALLCPATWSTPEAAADSTGPPRIAVWNPQKSTLETRFKLNLSELDQTAMWLQEAGMKVERVTSEELNQTDKFSSQKFDALVLPGEVFPIANVASLRKFTNGGGILVALEATIPFLIAIEPEAGGNWTMAPKTPSFAWQKTDVMDLFGLKYSYKPELHDSGTIHQPSALLREFLPNAKPIERRFPGRWVYNSAGAEIYPLLRSQRLDGADVTPQIYFARKGRNTSLVIGEGFATKGVEGWPGARETLVALMKLASGVARGDIKLEVATQASNLASLALPKPLQNRPGNLSIEPENAKPLARWGKFNGSSLDLPAAQNAASATLTQSLAPGSTLRLALPASLPAQAAFLRVRGAFINSGAGLKLSLQSAGGTRVIWNEIFTYIDSRSSGNFNAGLSGFPTEFTRLVFAPPEGAEAVIVSNPGTQPVYFDALQLEVRTRPSPLRIIGLGHGAPTISPQESRRWSSIRVNPRPQFVGPPDDPKRWAKMDAIMKGATAANKNIHLVLEGTAAWNAISPERYAQGEAAKRPHTVPPDPQKFASLIADIIARYGDNVDIYEVWNEPDIAQFWRGTNAEYIALFNAVAPVVERLDPSATLVMAGMSGFKETWISEMIEGQVPQRSDLFAFHPYSGKTAGWDTGYGLAQGSLLSRGLGLEIFCDESGFVSYNSEWFQPPPNFTPTVQARLLDIAMARLLATDLAKLSVFNAGGDGNAYGLFDKTGAPLPAYRVFEDYVPLGQNGGRRLDVSISSQDGAPLQGVYSAAASHDDGSVSIVINPVEVEALQLPQNPSNDFNNINGWTTFFGKAQHENGQVIVTPEAGKPYAGFYSIFPGRAERMPFMELNIPQSEGGYDLSFKLPDGKKIDVLTKQAAGIWKGDLRKILPPNAHDFEISFRVYGLTSFDSMQFSPPENPEVAAPIAMRILVPLPKTGRYTATAQSVEGKADSAIQLHGGNAQNWAEVTLALKSRTRLTLMPAN